MCRFNIIYAKNDNYGVLEQNGYSVWEETPVELTEGYTGYVCGYCNCGSFVGTMTVCGREYGSLDEMNECETQMQIARLKEIREFMHQPGYSDIKMDYVKKREALWVERDRLTEDITDYEIEQMEKLEQKYNYEIPAAAADAMYQEIDRRYQLVYDTDEYKAIEPVEFEIPSMVIDDVIERFENAEFTEARDEFEQYKEIFSQLLETNTQIMFTTVWCEAKDLRPVKSIKIDELVIEDLAGLKEDDVITIY